MRRSPFYAQPGYAPSFHRPHHNIFSNPYTPSPSPQSPSPRPQPRSVITIPVHDHLSVSPPSSSTPHPSNSTPPSATDIRTVDPAAAAAAAAARIQSHFRGFSVRRHQPLLQLRTIATAHKALEALKAELESPGFAQNVKTNEKERIRFNEAVMAVILRLDAIEGSILEVRLRRKEATKMAIKLQDAVDAMVMQEECEVLDVKQLDGVTASDSDRVVEDRNSLDKEQSDISSCLIFTKATQEDGAVTIANGEKSEDVDCVPVESYSPEEGDCGEGRHHRVDLRSDVEKVIEMAPAHMLGNIIDLADKPDEPESECVGMCAAEKLMPCIHEEEVMNIAEKESTCEEAKEGDIAKVIALDGANTSVDEDDVDNVVENDINGVITPARLEQEGETRCTSCEEECAVQKAEDEVVESIVPIEVGEGHVSARLQLSDRILLQQLSQDCKQLKSMLSKLLVQSSAQSKVICALADRLEMLEEQQTHCPQQCNRMKGHGRRKPKKGSKK